MWSSGVCSFRSGMKRGAYGQIGHRRHTLHTGACPGADVFLGGRRSSSCLPAPAVVQDAARAAACPGSHRGKTTASTRWPDVARHDGIRVQAGELWDARGIRLPRPSSMF